MPRPLTVHPNTAKTGVDITIGEIKLSLSAEEIDALLDRICEHRERLSPPRALPEVRIARHVAEDPRWWVTNEAPNPGVILQLLHPVWGLVTFHLPTSESETLAEALRQLAI